MLAKMQVKQVHIHIFHHFSLLHPIKSTIFPSFFPVNILRFSFKKIPFHPGATKAPGGGRGGRRACRPGGGGGRHRRGGARDAGGAQHVDAVPGRAGTRPSHGPGDPGGGYLSLDIPKVGKRMEKDGFEKNP